MADEFKAQPPEKTKFLLKLFSLTKLRIVKNFFINFCTDEAKFFKLSSFISSPQIRIIYYRYKFDFDLVFLWIYIQSFYVCD